MHTCVAVWQCFSLCLGTVFKQLRCACQVVLLPTTVLHTPPAPFAPFSCAGQRALGAPAVRADARGVAAQRGGRLPGAPGADPEAAGGRVFMLLRCQCCARLRFEPAPGWRRRGTPLELLTLLAPPPCSPLPPHPPLPHLPGHAVPGLQRPPGAPRRVGAHRPLSQLLPCPSGGPPHGRGQAGVGAVHHQPRAGAPAGRLGAVGRRRAAGAPLSTSLFLCRHFGGGWGLGKGRRGIHRWPAAAGAMASAAAGPVNNPHPPCTPPRPAPQATAVLALGCMHPACHALVLGECAVLQEDYLDRQMQRVGVLQTSSCSQLRLLRGFPTCATC